MTTEPRLELLPAVDVAGGEAVQLVQGIAGTGGQFGTPSPLHSRGRKRAPSGCTSSTSMPRSDAARTAACSPRSSARSTSRSR